MRVYYDFQIFSWQKYGGISRYFYELSTRLRNMGVDIEVKCFRSLNWYFREELGMYTYSRHRIIRGIDRRTFGKIFARLNKARALHDMKNCDILHPTYYNPYLLGRYKCKMVLTVYDMIHELYRDSYFSYDKATINNKNKMIHEADRIIAISDSTKRDVLRFFPDIEPEKISVIHLGASMPAVDGSLPSLVEGDYVLFVGERGGYKNFLRFVEAMRPILEIRKNLRVFCAGGGGAFRPLNSKQ